MPVKRARFIKIKRNERTAAASDPEFIAVPRSMLESVQPQARPQEIKSRIAPCVCKKKGGKWFCMRPDRVGGLVMVDGPFDTEDECKKLGVCG